LFLKGSDKLNSEFKTILDKYNTPMLPVVLLDLINLDGNDNIFFQLKSIYFFLDSGNKELKLPPVQIPEHTKSYLIKVANWLLDNGRDEYLTVYGKVRGAVLQRSLTMLRNHQKSVSGGSVHGVASSPMLVKSSPTAQNKILPL
jgi:exocyst complex protein 7